MNGTSSSGKSTIAKHLLENLERPYFHLSMDDFNAMRAKDRFPSLGSVEFEHVLRRTRRGFHRAIAGMASMGNFIVADLILGEEWRRVDLFSALQGYHVVLVGVFCRLDEVERRELARGDREVGQAARQYYQVHSGLAYDVEVDTTSTNSEACADTVVDFLNERRKDHL